MSKLERIIGGNMNSWGGIDVNYRPSGFSIDRGGVVREGHNDRGCRISGNGIVRDGYYNDTGLRIDHSNTIKRGY